MNLFGPRDATSTYHGFVDPSRCKMVDVSKASAKDAGAGAETTGELAVLGRRSPWEQRTVRYVLFRLAIVFLIRTYPQFRSSSNCFSLASSLGIGVSFFVCSRLAKPRICHNRLCISIGSSRPTILLFLPSFLPSDKTLIQLMLNHW